LRPIYSDKDIVKIKIDPRPRIERTAAKNGDPADVGCGHGFDTARAFDWRSPRGTQSSETTAARTTDHCCR
jgi:hypothetical protein